MRSSLTPVTAAAALAIAGLAVPATTAPTAPTAPTASAADLAPDGAQRCSVVTTAAEREFAKTYLDEEEDLGGKVIVGAWVRAIERVFPGAESYNDVELLAKVMPESLAEHYLEVRDSTSVADIPFGPTATQVEQLDAVDAVAEDAGARPAYVDASKSEAERAHAKSLTSALERHFPGLKAAKAESLAAVLQNDGTGEYFNTRLAYEHVIDQAAWDCRDLLRGDDKLAHIDLPTGTPVQHDPAPGSSQPEQGRASSAGATAGIVVFSLLAALGVSLALLATVGPQFGLALPELPDLSGLANIQL